MPSTMTREVLPNRRRSETFDFQHRNADGGAFTYTATVGFYADGRPGEVFLGAAKSGTTLDIGVKDSAIALSLALQYGCPLETIAPTFLRDANGLPEGPLGALVDILTTKGPPNMIRDEEAHLHNLPDSPRPMTASEALHLAIVAAWGHNTHPMTQAFADFVAEAIKDHGYAVLPAVPVPPGER